MVDCHVAGQKVCCNIVARPVTGRLLLGGTARFEGSLCNNVDRNTLYCNLWTDMKQMHQQNFSHLKIDLNLLAYLNLITL